MQIASPARGYFPSVCRLLYPGWLAPVLPHGPTMNGTLRAHLSHVLARGPIRCVVLEKRQRGSGQDSRGQLLVRDWKGAE